MKKLVKLTCGFFASLSALNLAGILKVGVFYEPLPPEQREKLV
ncbi:MULTISPECIES: hypothetical protein [Brevibacillus]|jgi:hypothetical protein|nr:MULTISPECIES: hypothetical protein [Brevibacillus]MDT3417671.1 hypothetical protein [Brevibacillus aydinogluensis]